MPPPNRTRLLPSPGRATGWRHVGPHAHRVCYACRPGPNRSRHGPVKKPTCSMLSARAASIGSAYSTNAKPRVAPAHDGVGTWQYVGRADREVKSEGSKKETTACQPSCSTVKTGRSTTATSATSAIRVHGHVQPTTPPPPRQSSTPAPPAGNPTSWPPSQPCPCPLRTAVLVPHDAHVERLRMRREQPTQHVVVGVGRQA